MDSLLITAIVIGLIISVVSYICGHDNGWNACYKDKQPDQKRTCRSKAIRIYTYANCKGCGALLVLSNGPRGNGDWKRLEDIVAWQRDDFQDAYTRTIKDEAGEEPT